jgi:serine protease AprX
MSTYRIFATQSELENLPEGVEAIAHYPAFIVVSASEDAIAQLRQRYPVENLESPVQAKPIPQIARTAMARTEPESEGEQSVVVYFRAPVREDWLRNLENAGARIVQPLGDSAVVVSSPNAQVRATLANLAEVDHIEPYVPTFRLRPEIITDIEQDANQETVARAAMQLARGETSPADTSNIALPGTLVADFFTQQDRLSAEGRIAQLGVEILSRDTPTRLVLNLTAANNPRDAFEAIATLPGLRLLEEKTIKKLYNNVARSVIGRSVVVGDSSDPNSPPTLGLTGQGEIVAVADTGIDTGDTTTLHLDFQGHTKQIQSFPISPSLSSLVSNPGSDDGANDKYSGHGTHVAGSVLGNGARAKALGLPPIAGMAPEAQLVFQAIEQAPKWNLQGRLYFYRLGTRPPVSGLFGIPDNLENLFQAAYNQGARIHTNSWGGGAPGGYDALCEDLDRFVWNHKDFLILVAAGNSGKDTSPAGDGIDLGSADSPGTAKNCLTVGASENNRPGEFSGTYGQWWPSDFPNEPFKSQQKIADKIDDIAAFSSRGPTTTGRRKPDVVAPGTFILSTRSSQIASNNFGWGSYPPAKNDYMFMGGTSMATPLVAGSVALVRQYLRQTVKIENPSAALLKATIIHSAEYLNYRFANPSSSRWADNEQGWGRVTLERVLAPQSPAKVLFVEGASQFCKNKG